MEKIAIISDVHGNKTALETVFKDIKSRNISRIFYLGDSVTKCAHPDIVIDMLKENCEVVLKGNCDESISNENAYNKKFWSRIKIGEDRAKYLANLPIIYEFYLSGYFIRLFHSSPFSLLHIYNPMFNDNKMFENVKEIKDPMDLFKNTNFIGKDIKDKVPDIIGYGHIHTSNLLKIKNKMIFNPGSVGIPVEMLNDPNLSDKSNRFSTLSSYAILEGNYNSKKLSTISITNVRVPYNLEKEILDIKNSDMPNKEKNILALRTATHIIL